MNLETLLKEAEDLFPERKPKGLTCYDFSLNKFPQGWQFSVTNSWQKWLDAKYETTFGCYAKPEWAVHAFLEYVAKNKINVKKLYEK